MSTGALLETLGPEVKTQEKQKDFVPLSKKDKNKNLMSVGRRRLLQHYWYKVPVLHIIKHQLMSTW